MSSPTAVIGESGMTMTPLADSGLLTKNMDEWGSYSMAVCMMDVPGE